MKPQLILKSYSPSPLAIIAKRVSDPTIQSFYGSELFYSAPKELGGECTEVRGNYFELTSFGSSQ